MNDIEWYSEWQRLVQRVTISGTASDNGWQQMTQRMIASEFDYINREIEDIYFQYNTLLLKHVKLFIFEKYNECKTKHLFLIKKVQ